MRTSTDPLVQQTLLAEQVASAINDPFPPEYPTPLDMLVVAHGAEAVEEAINFARAMGALPDEIEVPTQRCFVGMLVLPWWI